MSKTKDISEVKRSMVNQIEEGYEFIPLLRYHVSDKWFDKVTSSLDYGLVENMTDYNYQRCITILIREELDIPGGLFGADSTEFIKERGGLEVMNIELSLLAPCATLTKYQYVKDVDNPEGGLVIEDLTQFKNKKMEESFQRLERLLKKEEMTLVTRESLSAPLPGVKLEYVEEGIPTYFDYLFC